MAYIVITYALHCMYKNIILAGISGTSSADAAGLGMVEIEAMDRAGYDRKWSVGITMASSIL